MICLEEKEHQLFVGGMHRDSNIEEIELALKNIGEYSEFRLILDNRNAHRGYAFITVPEKSLKAFLESEICISNTKLFINKAQKKCDDSSVTKRLYFMKDFMDPSPLDESRVKKFFMRYGKISDVHIFTNHVGKSKGYGFCDFTEDEAKHRLLKQKSSTIGVD